VADAGARRHGVEIGERLGTPFEEVIALHVALIFDLDILLERLGVAELVDHHRVVDHEVDRHQRVDLAGVAAQLRDRVAHRGKVDHAGHAGEILQQHARRAILDLVGGFGRVLLPVDQRLMSSVETVKPPSSKRSRFSSRTFIENGRREMSPSFSAAFLSE
jgi:hypothetical protein